MNRILFIFLIFIGCTKKIEVLPNQVGIIINETTIDTTKVLYVGSYILKYSQEVKYFDISNQSRDFTIVNILKDEKVISISMTIFFHPVYEKVPYLYREYENNYIDKWMIPEVRKSISKELEKYNSFDISSKELLEENIFKILNDSHKNSINFLHVKISKLLIGNIEGGTNR